MTANVTHKQQPQTMATDDKAASLGPLGVNYLLKKQSDGTLEKSVVVCRLCQKELTCH